MMAIIEQNLCTRDNTDSFLLLDASSSLLVPFSEHLMESGLRSVFSAVAKVDRIGVKDTLGSLLVRSMAA